MTESRKKTTDLEYGAVCVTHGAHKGRVGTYDDDEGARAIVYFGHPLFSPGYFEVPLRQLKKPTTNDLLTRLQALYEVIGIRARLRPPEQRPTLEEQVDFL